MFKYIFVAFLFLSTLQAEKLNVDKKKKKTEVLIKKHLKRLKKVDGGIRLVGGRAENEGNVEILHDGGWGAICDDEWDTSEAEVVCEQLGYMEKKVRPTSNAYFGVAKRKFWMDNVYCNGTEHELTDCRFNGWGLHDCGDTEAAGVICDDTDQHIINQNVVNPNPIRNRSLVEYKEMRLKGGRMPSEGRVELRNKDDGRWNAICAEGWSLREALVICKTLGLGYASDAIQTTYFGGNLTKRSLAGVTCTSNETSFSQCFHRPELTGTCESGDGEVAAVACTKSLADLIIDREELIRSAYLEDKQMFFLQCAMEENCVASTAYEIQKENPGWHLETRRLLRFTTRILNGGTEDFRPFIPKHLWEWHMCHMHYHSMEVFATFDIIDSKGKRVAEGHKASFCLEDNQCLPGVTPKYACAHYGDQGIKVNCSDIYKHTVDCQWIDITDLSPGNYKIKVAVNPEYKVGEMSYVNNAALCDFVYAETFGAVSNCVLQIP